MKKLQELIDKHVFSPKNIKRFHQKFSKVLIQLKNLKKINFIDTKIIKTQIFILQRFGATFD